LVKGAIVLGTLVHALGSKNKKIKTAITRVKDATTDRKKNPVEKNKMFHSCNRKGPTTGHARVILYGLKALKISFKLVDFL
jgi:hypothetical protein